ncbi:hypothetical protein ACJMK2_043559 [Sinanodonta woodiana]|uniref:Uncharacterized protein n=1 Tax=Sinanodonta woodiana TaxID=1069815 RepID=A0ABD3VXB4_SINWO
MNAQEDGLLENKHRKRNASAKKQIEQQSEVKAASISIFTPPLDEEKDKSRCEPSTADQGSQTCDEDHTTCSVTDEIEQDPLVISLRKWQKARKDVRK